MRPGVSFGLLAALSLAALPACESSDEAGHAPAMSNLQFSPVQVTVNVPASIAGTVNVVDSDGDFAALDVHIVSPSGVTGDLSLPIPNPTGLTEGTVPFNLAFTATEIGAYSLEFRVEDATGLSSAPLIRTLTSEAAASTAPSIKRLTAQPLLVTQGVAATIAGTVELTDPNGDTTEVRLALTAPSGAAGPTATVAVDLDGATTGTVSFSLPFTASEVGDHTLSAVAHDATGDASAPATLTIEARDTTGVQDVCAATAKDCTGQGFCYNVTESTCAYFAERNLTLDACDDVTAGSAVATCVSSIADLDSPWAATDANCDFVQYWSNPTDLPIDCRCSDAAFEDRCERPYNLDAAVSFGAGPRMRDLAGNVHAHNGALIGREWFVPVGWSGFNRADQTLIFAIHLDTGDRRRVSGTYVDPSEGTTTLGSGPDFVNVLDLQLGADGMLYAMGARSDIAPPKVWRVDPISGDRPLLFDEETAAEATLCPNGSTLPGRKVVQMVGEGWTMDAAGNHYFSIINTPGPSIVKFPPDFSSCSYLTRVTTATQTTLTDNVGAGYDIVQFNFRAFSVEGGKLYAVSDTKLIEVELATGKRKLISNAKEVGGLGAGPINAEGLGHRWSRWDPYRNTLWTVGLEGMSQAVAVDLTTGDRTPWPCWHPGLGLQANCNNVGTALVPGFLNFGGFIIDPLPPHDLFFAHDLFSVVRYEVKTGNAYILSL